jgi:hypothetical protein
MASRGAASWGGTAGNERRSGPAREEKEHEDSEAVMRRRDGRGKETRRRMRQKRVGATEREK